MNRTTTLARYDDAMRAVLSPAGIEAMVKKTRGNRYVSKPQEQRCAIRLASPEYAQHATANQTAGKARESVDPENTAPALSSK